MVPDDGNDLIVITVCITNFDVKKVLVDNGSAVETLSLDAFKAMRLKEEDLKPAKPIYGFANQPIRVLGQVTLPVTLGQGEHKFTVLACFLVVDQPSAYKAILGLPLMKLTQMVTAVFCLTMKFLTPTRIGYVRADRTAAKKCHFNSLRMVESQKWVQDVMRIIVTQDI